MRGLGQIRSPCCPAQRFQEHWDRNHWLPSLIQFGAKLGHAIRSVHLHGLASKPQSIVATDESYQRLYIDDDPPPGSTRDALAMIFASGPLLFMGVSLIEPDVLRPLRQSVLDRSSRGKGAASLRPLAAPHDAECRTLMMRKSGSPKRGGTDTNATASRRSLSS